MITATKWHAKLDGRRQRLQMSKRTVSKRAGVSLPTVNRILSGSEQNPTLDNIRAIANAIGVRVTIGESVTVDEIDDEHEFRSRQAAVKARQLVSMVQGTMALEAQGVDQKSINNMIEQTRCELLSGSPRRLWDE